MKTYFIETYGCQMNSAESNSLEAILQGAGMTACYKQEDADLAVINTCSVRQSAENRIWGRLGSYNPIKKKRKMTLVVTGCMADRLGEELKKKAPQVDYVVPVNDKMKILDIVRSGENCNSEKYEFSETYWHEGEFSSYVPIMNGCNNFCSYCIVPYVRGREVSRDPNQILREIEFLESKGVREITLLGQNVNSYNYNGLTFPQLLSTVCRHLNNIKWVRFESPHPKDFSDELIEVIAREGRVAKHLHIPMQSGSTRILNLMNRRYTREAYLALIDRIRNRIPEISFAVDVMVGFPGETDEEFRQTLSAMDLAGYIEAYMYYWNPREGTRACSMEGQMPESDKQKRLQILIDHQLEAAAKIKAGRTGTVQEVLVLSVSRDNPSQMLGRNEHNEMVAFTPAEGSEKPAPGSIVNVQFLLLNGNTFVGKQV